jgi:DNA-binding NtrC family response regulator
VTKNIHNTPPASSTEGSPQGAPGPWILVVDDEPSIRRLMEFLLRSQGWTVLSADGAAQAMETLAAESTPPSLVICDVLMPHVDGLELVRRMCARLKGLNVIFVSGHLTDVSWWPEDLKDHRFLPKPFENAQLIAAVKDAIGGGNAS